MLVHLICSWYMALLNDDALETGENVYKIAGERSERADFLYLRWKHTILLKSQYIHCWLITVCRYNMSMTVFVTLVIWSCSLETRNLRKMISSEPKYLYFCVGKMFYIPTRNSRKSYKWLRFASKPFFCVCLKHAILLNIVLVNHIVCRYNVSLCS